MSGQKLAALPPGPWSVRETRVPIGDTGDHDVFIDVVDATGKLVVSLIAGDKEIALAHALKAIPDFMDAAHSAINELRGLQASMQLASLSAVTRALIEHQAMKLEGALKKAQGAA